MCTAAALTDTIVSIYSFENFVAIFLVGQVVRADAAKYGGLPQGLPRAVAGGPAIYSL